MGVHIYILGPTGIIKRISHAVSWGSRGSTHGLGPGVACRICEADLAKYPEPETLIPTLNPTSKPKP